MATTDYGFTPVRNEGGRTTGIRKSYIIDDSQTIHIGDMVLLETTGFIIPATAGSRILGCIIGITDSNGLDMDNSQAINTGSTWTSPNTIVTDSDNTTVDQQRAIVDIDPFTLYSNQPNGAINTTSSSGKCGLKGSYVDLASACQVDENNAGNAFNVTAQLFCWGLDPENTARGLYSIAEHQIWGA